MGPNVERLKPPVSGRPVTASRRKQARGRRPTRRLGFVPGGSVDDVIHNFLIAWSKQKQAERFQGDPLRSLGTPGWVEPQC
jgi:hypothetical protein